MNERPRRASEIQDRVAGGLFGLLIGDALGVPFEFRSPEAIPPASEIEYTTGTHNQPPGTWSDDGAQALCLFESLIARDRLDVLDFSQKLVAWMDRGHMAVGGKVFDVGVTTRQAIEALKAGTDPMLSGLKSVESNGNGSLMRTLPISLWAALKRDHDGEEAVSIPDVITMAHAASSVTHAHPRAQVCCAFYAVAALLMIENPDTPAFPAAAVYLLDWYTRPRVPREFGQELASILDIIKGDPMGTGYVVDSLCAARNLINDTFDFEGAVRRAIRLGNDTDTTAAIVGGLAGIRCGMNGLPKRWYMELREKNLVISNLVISLFSPGGAK